ncbi:MAG: hypothetical protein JRN15_11170 [Nitrososphaerota archaeon]|nr:hypothetical protein [Nitrososphaerota archaeon]
MFGRNKSKVEFDARLPTPTEIAKTPQSFSYLHNFRVHFKQNSMRVIAHSIEVSVSGESPQLPLTNWVTYEFDKQMRKKNNGRKIRDRSIQTSYRITNIQYVRSTATRIEYPNLLSAKEP